MCEWEGVHERVSVLAQSLGAREYGLLSKAEPIGNAKLVPTPRYRLYDSEHRTGFFGKAAINKVDYKGFLYPVGPSRVIKSGKLASQGLNRATVVAVVPRIACAWLGGVFNHRTFASK